jgi:hypothetical protein
MSMSDRKIKGTMLIDQVRLIRANKHLDWTPYLGAAEWEAISVRLLPTEWYPLDLYEKCGWATFNVLARGSAELVRHRGRQRGKELFETTYKALTVGQDPIRALERFVKSYALLFNFATLRFEKLTDRHARIHRDHELQRPSNLPYCQLLMGHLEALIKVTGGRNIRVDFLTMQWEGSPSTILDCVWDL